MLSALAGKTETVRDILKTPEYINYHADALVSDAGARVPPVLRPQVIAYLKPLIAKLHSDVRMQELIQNARNGETQAMILRFIRELPNPAVPISQFLMRGDPSLGQSFIKTYNANFAQALLNAAQVPAKYHADILHYLIPEIEAEIKTGRRKEALLRMASHTCNREVILSNIRNREATTLSNKDLDEESKQAVYDSLMETTATTLRQGIYLIEKEKFTYNERGEVNGVTEEKGQRGRSPACHEALQRGEHLEIIPEVEEEGGRRRASRRKTVKRPVVRRRKTVRRVSRRKTTTKTKTAKGGR